MYINPNIAALYRTHSSFTRQDYLRLDMNENPIGLPQSFFEDVLKRITPSLLATYPETESLIGIIAAKHDLAPANVVIGNGSDEIIRDAFFVFGEKGKDLVCVDPSFAMYSVYANMFGMHKKFLSYDETMSIDIATILNAIDDNTGIVILVNPNNPMGNVYSVEEIAAVAKKSAQVNALLIVDEAYHYFCPITFAEHVLEYQNLILTRTFSKVCSIASLRLGYALADDKLADLLRRSQPSYSINSVAIEFGKAILDEPALIERLTRIHADGKAHLLERLLAEDYMTIARDGNFLFIRTKTPPEAVESRLQEKRILVKHYKNSITSDYIRVTTGDRESMDVFMDTLLEVDR